MSLTPYPTLRLKVTPAPSIKVRVLPSFSATLTGSDPIVVDNNGGNYQIGLDIPSLLGQIADASAARQTLTADRTYYVRPIDGDDSSSGLEDLPGLAFQTLQHAWDVIETTLDRGQFAVNVRGGDGTYGAGVIALGPGIGSGLISFLGNLSTPTNCKVNSSAEAFMAINGARFKVDGFEIAGVNACIEAANQGQIIAGSNIRYGACSFYQIRAVNEGFVDIQGFSWSVIASAAAHINAALGGVVNMNGSTINIPLGVIGFTSFAKVDRGGILYAGGVTINNSGTVTGARFSLTSGGLIDTGGLGLNLFPGNSAGTGDGTGIYDGVIIGTQTINTNSAAPPSPVSGTIQHLVGAGFSGQFLSTWASLPFVFGRRAEGSIASPSAVQSGQNLLYLGGLGYGTTYATIAGVGIGLQAAENWSASAQGTKIVFQTTPLGSTAAADAAYIGADKSFQPVGRLDLSSATSGQIKFPATQNPSSDVNTLDDYEEGTWTPSFTFQTPGDLAVTYGVQLGTYTKIGNVVVATCRIQTSAFTYTTASGAALINGLPFTAGGIQGYFGMRWQGVTAAGYTDLLATPGIGTAQLSLRMSGSGQAVIIPSTTQIASGGSIQFEGTGSFTV